MADQDMARKCCQMGWIGCHILYIVCIHFQIKLLLFKPGNVFKLEYLSMLFFFAGTNVTIRDLHGMRY